MLVRDSFCCAEVITTVFDVEVQDYEKPEAYARNYLAFFRKFVWEPTNG